MAQVVLVCRKTANKQTKLAQSRSSFPYVLLRPVGGRKFRSGAVGTVLGVFALRRPGAPLDCTYFKLFFGCKWPRHDHSVDNCSSEVGLVSMILGQATCTHVSGLQ